MVLQWNEEVRIDDVRRIYYFIQGLSNAGLHPGDIHRQDRRVVLPGAGAASRFAGFVNRDAWEILTAGTYK